MMFRRKIGRNMEVNVDNMLVKSAKVEQYLTELEAKKFLEL